MPAKWCWSQTTSPIESTRQIRSVRIGAIRIQMSGFRLPCLSAAVLPLAGCSGESSLWTSQLETSVAATASTAPPAVTVEY